MYPVLALFRRPLRLKREESPDSGTGILALLSNDRRVLLSTDRLLPKQPTGIAAKLPQRAALEVDVELMENDMVPVVTVDDRQLVVNGVDFKALLRAVATTKVRSPEIKAVLPRLQAVANTHYTGVPSDYASTDRSDLDQP